MPKKFNQLPVKYWELADAEIIYAAVDVMKYPDWIIKHLSNIIVIINYVLSKFLVFWEKESA